MRGRTPRALVASHAPAEHHGGPGLTATATSVDRSVWPLMDTVPAVFTEAEEAAAVEASGGEAGTEAARAGAPSLDGDAAAGAAATPLPPALPPPLSLGSLAAAPAKAEPQDSRVGGSGGAQSAGGAGLGLEERKQLLTATLCAATPRAAFHREGRTRDGLTARPNTSQLSEDTEARCRRLASLFAPPRNAQPPQPRRPSFSAVEGQPPCGGGQVSALAGSRVSEGAETDSVERAARGRARGGGDVAGGSGVGSGASGAVGHNCSSGGVSNLMPNRGEVLNAVHDEYAERYGITTQELERRQDIPLAERTALNRGEFVRLQQLMKRRLNGTLAEQGAARVPLYRMRAKAAQHIDAAAASNWGASCVRKLLQSEVDTMQADFEATLKRREDERRDGDDSDECRRRQERAASLAKMRAAVQARHAATAIMKNAGVVNNCGTGSGGGAAKRRSQVGKRFGKAGVSKRAILAHGIGGAAAVASGRSPGAGTHRSQGGGSN
eukprot:Transcript_32033.p1 GENE.Transcript_32033~~Transcript_32033.p1  ORF type:complete len:496 (+),score=80.30 Transcript_32033:1198-2685(+)